MSKPKAKYNFTSQQLNDWEIPVADFAVDPWNAIYDAATEIGENKGYGAEGIGEVAIEIFEDLGISNDDQEIFEDAEDGLFTIDGKFPDRKACEIASAQAEVKRLQGELNAAKRQLKLLTK